MTENKKRPALSFWQIWNMTFGFLGIQIGWGLQMGNMSAIYDMLGASPDEIPMLWLAAPLTGLIVQPIIGYLSDRTWHPTLGRRRPYFLIGALLASVALIWMPYSGSVMMAAGLLWVLDASINIGMEPTRAFVADLVPEHQLAKGYSFQSWFIGLGAVIAAVLPWVLLNWFGYTGTAPEGQIPEYQKLMFLVGGVCLLLAMVYTVVTTKEYPPEYYEADETEDMGYFEGLKHAFKNMPPAFLKLAPVQFFTWMGLFLMWFYLTVTIATHIYGGAEGDELYAQGVATANLCFGFYAIIQVLYALFIPKLAERFGYAKTHAFNLICGGLGLLFLYTVSEPSTLRLMIAMTGVGMAWASIVSMPYAMIARDIPPKQMGIFMGLFNMFIVIPEIIAALGFGWVMRNLLDNNTLHAVMLGGGLLIIAGLLSLRVAEPEPYDA